MQAFRDRCGINKIAKTDLAGDVIVESFELDFSFHVGHFFSAAPRCVFPKPISNIQYSMLAVQNTELVC